MLCVCACVYILISPFYPPYQVSRFWSHRRGHWSQEEFSYMLEFTQRLTKLGSKLRPIWFPVPCAFYHSLLPFPRSESSFSIPFNWRWRQNRIFNFNYKEAKKTVFLPAYNTSICTTGTQLALTVNILCEIEGPASHEQRANALPKPLKLLQASRA